MLEMNQVSLFQVGMPQYQPFSEAKPIFSGKGSKEYREFLAEFGVLDDLEITKVCSNKTLKKLLSELEQAFAKYYSLKGLALSLKKKPSSVENHDLVENNNQMLQEANTELSKLLLQIFSCIVLKKASKYKNYIVSANHFGCTIYSYVYYSSMKELSKRIVALLEETLSSFIKSKCSCKQFNSNVKQSSCYYLFFSVKAIKASIATETSYFCQYKRIKKNCESYAYLSLRKVLSFR
ncbi:hypothetical protein CmeUKMEL1_02935 [Cryptosporidium meleagridis]|uniref:Uncharacterized protein n=1 Tax=Cryptosporidium meleagridis TaxID=93969 RepID=A0A2P4YXX9_9CRYT|nr:hypothetical protein CmeUKMEL1_02935 [Cryptosporidium meleagridis]